MPKPAPSSGSSGSAQQIRIVWTDDGLSRGFQEFPDRLGKAIEKFMQYQSSKVQDFARSTAPWSDRTGNARQGLFASDYQQDGVWGIVLYHTVPYGIWLEVANSGNFAVIIPTVTEEGVRIMNSLGSLLTKMDI